MMSRKERRRKAAEKRRRKWRRVALHAAALGLSALLLGGGVYFIWSHEPAGIFPWASGEIGGGAGGSGRQAEEGGAPDGTGTEAAGAAGPDGGAAPGGAATDGGSRAAGADAEAGPAVRLLFVGDVMMGARIADMLEREGYDYPYRHVGEALRAADLAVGNLENPITDRGEPADKTWTFRASPLTAPAMKAGGFDAFSLANNHVLDYGVDGLLDTLQYLDEAGIGWAGAGRDAEEAYRAFVAEVKGVRVAVLGFSHVVPEVGWKATDGRPGVAEAYDMRRALAAVGEAREAADLVVVMVHWGIERAEEPEPYQVEKAHAFIEAGADLVIGSHPHVLQGIEAYNGKWIAYSLGNFIFTVSPNAETRQSAMLQADCRAGGKAGAACSLAVIPVETGPGQPIYPEEEGARAILDRLNRLSYRVKVHEDGSVVPDPLGRVYDPESVARKKAEAEAAKAAEAPETAETDETAETLEADKTPETAEAGVTPVAAETDERPEAAESAEAAEQAEGSRDGSPREASPGRAKPDLE